ncbi:MAG TPA: MmgE/PrpD family protein [Bryobacteraceae bacterium]|nr:MmgE/PrpD family protein [Bryobacteraceae bacterium]
MTRRELAHGAALALGAGLLSRRPLFAADPAPAATDYVAGFIAQTRFPDIPAQVLELARKSILDGLGLALAGSVAETGDLVRKYLESTGLSQMKGATVIGSSLKAPLRFAAFANGVGIHADDYDDTQLAVAKDRVYGLLTHPTAPVLPAALAVAESRSMSGQELLLAYNLGVEVETKINEAIAPRHYEEGFHSTGTAGVFGGAAAAAKLMALDKPRILRALGIAASEAAGLRENFGTMTKPFHAGRAAESGVVAAEFAALGWTANDRILEAPRGFFQAAGGGWDPAALMNKLANPWTFVSPGISIKPSPSGSLTHPGIGEMLRLIREHKIMADQVVSVDVGTNKNMPNALIYHQPKDNLQGKFSMEFCMAAALLYGKVGLAEFTTEVVNRAPVQDLIRRVHFGVSPVAEAAGYDKMTTIIDVHMKDGRTISGRADFAKGSPANPMSFDEVAAKFADCAGAAKWPESKSKAIVAMVKTLEDLKDVRDLTRLCAI